MYNISTLSSLLFGKTFTMRRAKSVNIEWYCMNSGGNAVPKLLRELHQLKHQIQVIVCVLCIVCIQYLELTMSVSVVQLKAHKIITSFTA